MSPPPLLLPPLQAGGEVGVTLTEGGADETPSPSSQPLFEVEGEPKLKPPLGAGAPAEGVDKLNPKLGFVLAPELTPPPEGAGVDEPKPKLGFTLADVSVVDAVSAAGELPKLNLAPALPPAPDAMTDPKVVFPAGPPNGDGAAEEEVDEGAAFE